MSIISGDCTDVAFHGEATGTVLIIPVKFYAKALPEFLVSGDGVVLFKDRSKVFGLEFLDIIDAKIIYYKQKHDKAPFVQPQDGGGGCLIVASGSEAFTEEFVGQFSQLG